MHAASAHRAETNPMHTSAEQASRHTRREFLSSRLGAEACGIDILKVQKIRVYEAPTRMANAPSFTKGVANLRGVTAPTVDMRIRFCLEEIECNSFTAVIILNIAGRTVGMVADSVSDGLELGGEVVRLAPEFKGAIDANCIAGPGAMKNGEALRMLILMDIEQVMSSPYRRLMNMVMH